MKWILFMALIVSVAGAKAESNFEEKGGLKWYTDLSAAHTDAEKTNKPIFGFFTGSDWCGWCTKLQREVFAKPAFIDWAKKNVVLLELDFPKRTPQSPELKTQNQNLQRALGVGGYPTVWLFQSALNPDNGGFNLTRMGKLGYPRGAEAGKEEVKFLDDANKILAGAQKS